MTVPKGGDLSESNSFITLSVLESEAIKLKFIVFHEKYFWAYWLKIAGKCWCSELKYLLVEYFR